MRRTWPRKCFCGCSGIYSGVEGDPKAWLYRVTVNVCNDHHRRRMPVLNDTVTEGVLPGTTNLNYRLAYNSLEVSPGDPRTVHINGLGFSLRGPTITSTSKDNVTTDRTQTPAKIHTDLDVREGQKTVVGKSSVNSAGDALILVIVPKVVD